ncbi:MAG: DUF362 domain-containing protein [Eubacteriales bacterium]|nr:DUF362 domain-containing protein [Eubacteriales bacterium]
MEKNQIIKTYGTQYCQMTQDLLEAADLASMIPGKDCRIGIKPNLVAPSEASWGATTHPEIVEGILIYLQEHGFRNLLMLEGSWVGDRTSEAIEVCGYDRLSEKYRVEFLDTQKDRTYKKDCSGLELELCAAAKEIDFLINVPVMKGHCQTKMTCALKNMKGLLPNREKRHFHAMGLHKPIAHLSAGLHQDFIVVDHICGDLDFEDGGNPVVRNCIMAACDPVLTDAYVCGLLHYQTEEVPYIKMAEALGVGSSDLSKAEILVLSSEGQKDLQILTGDKIWDEELPYAEKVVAVSDMVEEVDSCSACYGYLVPVLDQLREEGLLDQLHEKICIGQGYRGKSGKLGVGNCTSGFEFCIKGCPPVEEDIYRGLKKYLNADKQCPDSKA